MHSLVYRSLASDSFDVPEIYKMLGDARNYNATHQITGCLLYHNKQFLQLLEGDEEEVIPLFERISKDPRHTDLTILSQSPLKNRIFNEWSMAFHDYGQNGSAAYVKMKQIDNFFEQSNAFAKPSKLAMEFFSNVKDVLFTEPLHK